MLAEIKTLLVEDDKYWQERIQERLEPYGITPVIAQTVAEAQEKTESLWEHWDVAILDNEINEDDKRAPKGPEIILDARRKRNSFGPECIVFTSHDAKDYYRLALDLVAAVYLKKPGVGKKLDPLAHYVRVLALRRALNERNAEIASEVERIAGQNRNLPTAIRKFCEDVLKSKFEVYLDVGFVILLTDDKKTVNCANNVNLKDADKSSELFYHTLQALAHGMGNPTDPFLLDVSELDPPNGETAPLYEILDRTALVPISLSNNLRLSIGILPHKGDLAGSYQSNQEHLCSVLAQHLRPTVLESIISLWSHWEKFSVTRSSMAKLCLSVGHDISTCVAANDQGELDDLAKDLRESGGYLAQLDNEKPPRGMQEVKLEEEVKKAWPWVADPAATNILKVEGECSIQMRKRDLAMIVSRLLQWLVYRSQFTPFDVSPSIKVSCDATSSEASITFEDVSERLPKELRDDMFAPFTQTLSTPFPRIDGAAPSNEPTSELSAPPNTGRYLPLYLAKMLIEGLYHGVLQDRSDEIQDVPYGHRILMRLPLNAS